MPLVRCPLHNIPYNDRNPRGCPACALEREGTEQAALTREPAQAAGGAARVEILPPPEPDADSGIARTAGRRPPVTHPPGRRPSSRPPGRSWHSPSETTSSG